MASAITTVLRSGRSCHHRGLFWPAVYVPACRSRKSRAPAGFSAAFSVSRITCRNCSSTRFIASVVIVQSLRYRPGRAGGRTVRSYIAPSQETIFTSFLPEQCGVCFRLVGRTSGSNASCDSPDQRATRPAQAIVQRIMAFRTNALSLAAKGVPNGTSAHQGACFFERAGARVENECTVIVFPSVLPGRRRSESALTPRDADPDFRPMKRVGISGPVSVRNGRFQPLALTHVCATLGKPNVAICTYRSRATSRECCQVSSRSCRAPWQI